jgi:hypothetical protein
MAYIPIKSSDRSKFQHDRLYRFWQRSQGIWLSKLVNMTIRLLDPQEFLASTPIETLKTPEFGIKLSWEYNTKAESGQMFWWVDLDRGNLIFTNKGIEDASQPSIYHYQMISDDTLVTAIGKFEETNLLEGNSRRLREIRFDGQLVRRHWESKFSA